MNICLVRLISYRLPVCLLVLGVFSLALSFGSFRTTLSSDTTTALCWVSLDTSPQVLLFFFTAAIWWLADLFTLVIGGERLRGVGVFCFLEGGFSSMPLSLKRGGFYSFRAAQPHTVECSNAQSCTVMHSWCTVKHNIAQSSTTLHSWAQHCKVVHSWCTVKCSNAQLHTVDAQSSWQQPWNALI